MKAGPIKKSASSTPTDASALALFGLTLFGLLALLFAGAGLQGYEPIFRKIIFLVGSILFLGGGYGIRSLSGDSAGLANPPHWVRIPIAIGLLAFSAELLTIKGPARIASVLVALLAVSAGLGPLKGLVGLFTRHASLGAHAAGAGVLLAFSFGFYSGFFLSHDIFPWTRELIRWIGAVIGAAVVLVEVLPRSGAPWTALLLLANGLYLGRIDGTPGPLPCLALAALDLPCAGYWISQVGRQNKEWGRAAERHR